MTRKVKVCTENTLLQDVAFLMSQFEIGAVPVVDNKEALNPIGIITDRDMVCRGLAKGLGTQGETVRDFMSSSCITTIGESPLSHATELMEKNQVRRIIVVDREGRCCGILSQADLAGYDSDGNVADFLRAVSQPQTRAENRNF